MSSTRARPFIRSDGSAPGTGKGVVKGKRHVSDEGRQRLSELAKARHAAGGFQKSGDGLPARQRRKRKPSRDRVAQMVAQAALEKKNADAIIEVFKDGIHPNQPMTTRLKAAEAWLGIEREEAKQALREQDADDQKKDRNELLEILSEGLTTGYGALLLRKRLEAGEDITESENGEDIIDVEVIDESCGDTP